MSPCLFSGVKTTKQLDRKLLDEYRLVSWTTFFHGESRLVAESVSARGVCDDGGRGREVINTRRENTDTHEWMNGSRKPPPPFTDREPYD